MKFDMHCHTKEGSSDSKVSIIEYAKLLAEQGFDGMMVTDHDSYGGYEYYINHVDEAPKGFTVLKGIEYDTYEAGHFLVVMPDGISLDILQYKGLKVKKLIDIVHRYGGVLGPAHPCGEPFLSVFSTGRYKRDKSLATQVDFIEGFNCGEDDRANAEAVSIAKKYSKTITAGSDSHWKECVGLAYTVFESDIRCNNDFIEYVKSRKSTVISGKAYNGTIKARLGKLNKLLVYGFFPYNKLGALRYMRLRRKALKGLEKR